MRRILLTCAVFAFSTPALALVQIADGDWDCSIGEERFGGINIDGESYRFTDLAGRKYGGDVAAELDGVSYYVESGTLRDDAGLTNLIYEENGGGPTLVLYTGDLGALERVGACTRP